MANNLSKLNLSLFYETQDQFVIKSFIPQMSQLVSSCRHEDLERQLVPIYV